MSFGPYKAIWVLAFLPFVWSLKFCYSPSLSHLPVATFIIPLFIPLASQFMLCKLHYLNLDFLFLCFVSSFFCSLVFYCWTLFSGFSSPVSLCYLFSSLHSCSPFCGSSARFLDSRILSSSLKLYSVFRFILSFLFPKWSAGPKLLTWMTTNSFHSGVSKCSPCFGFP